MAFMVLVILVGAMMAYVRLSPSDVERWHVPVVGEVDKDMKGGAIRVVAAGPDAFALVDQAARDLPRTQVLAGSVDEGRVTYVTRSAVMGFPDYTTVEQSGDELKLYARLRFGGSDFGVNAARLRELLAALP